MSKEQDREMEKAHQEYHAQTIPRTSRAQIRKEAEQEYWVEVGYPKGFGKSFEHALDIMARLCGGANDGPMLDGYTVITYMFMTVEGQQKFLRIVSEFVEPHQYVTIMAEPDLFEPGETKTSEEGVTEPSEPVLAP